MLSGATHAPDSSASSQGRLSVTPMSWLGRAPHPRAHTRNTRAHASVTLFTLRLLSFHLSLEAAIRPDCPLQRQRASPARFPPQCGSPNGPALPPSLLCSCDLPTFAGVVREPVSLARGGPRRGRTLPSNTGAPCLAEVPFPIARLANGTPEGRLCRWAAWV